MPSLPVDSAMSCSAQSANPTMCVPSATIASLSRSGAVAAIAAPSTSPGFSGLSMASESSIVSASSRISAMSAPASPEGTSPNAVSAE